MPDYDISASLDLLLSKPWDDVLAENPKFKQATENWGAQTAANYKSVWKPESKPSLSSHLTGYINDGKFEAIATCRLKGCALSTLPKGASAWAGDAACKSGAAEVVSGSRRHTRRNTRRVRSRETHSAKLPVTVRTGEYGKNSSPSA